MTLLASTLPSNDGYVAAAYIVFFVLVLVYVAIMAIRLSRVERKLGELQRTREQTPSGGDAHNGAPSSADSHTHDSEWERETV